MKKETALWLITLIAHAVVMIEDGRVGFGWEWQKITLGDLSKLVRGKSQS